MFGSNPTPYLNIDRAELKDSMTIIFIRSQHSIFLPLVHHSYTFLGNLLQEIYIILSINMKKTTLLLLLMGLLIQAYAQEKTKRHEIGLSPIVNHQVTSFDFLLETLY